MWRVQWSRQQKELQMLIIRQQQMEVFAQATRQHFEDEMVVHSKGFTPRL